MIQILANERDILKFQDHLDTNGRNSRIEKIEKHKADNKDYFLVSFKRSVGSYYPSFEDLLDKKKTFYTIPEVKKILEKDAKREFFASCKEERFTEDQIKLMYDPNVPDEVLIEKKLMILDGFYFALKEINRYNLNYQQLNSIRVSLICGSPLQHAIKKNKNLETLNYDLEDIRHYQARDLLKRGIAYPYFYSTDEVDNVYAHKYWQNMKLENRPFNEALLKFAADKGHEKWYQFYQELKDLIKNSDDFLTSGDIDKLYKNNVYEHIVRMDECYKKMNNNIYSVHMGTISKYRDALLNSREEYNFDDFLKLYQEREAEIYNIESPYIIEMPSLPENHELASKKDITTLDQTADNQENFKVKEEQKEGKNTLNLVEEELVKEFLEVYLYQDNEKWEKGFTTQLPINAKNGKEYSGLNQIRLQMYLLKNELDDPRFITFNQAKENNWFIKKGAKSIRICYRMPYDKSTNEPFNLEQVTNLSEEEKNQVLEEKVKWVLKYYNVFHAKDVEGIPAYEAPSNLNFDDTNLQIDFIRNCIKGMQLHYRESPNINAASYNMIEDRIMMPKKNQFESEGAYFATILHELGHATGHEKRLNRNLNPDSSTEEYIMEELVAELNSLFMQSNIKLSKYMDKENSFSYLNSWLVQSKNEPEVIMAAIKEAVKAKNYLLDAGKYNELFQEKESIDLKQPQTFLFARGVEDEVVIYEMNEENFNKVMKKASMLNNENSKIELAHFDNEGNPIYSQLLDSGLTSYDSFKNKKSDLKFQTAINLSWKNEIENYFKKEIHLEELLQKEKQEEVLNKKIEKNDNRKRYDSRNLELLKKISITQYATEILGWNPKKVGKNKVSFAQHDSLIVFENTNTYSQYSKREGGSIIDFVKNVEKLEMNDAIKKLQDYYDKNSKNINFKISTIEEIKESDNGLIIPERNKTNRNAIDYLQKRGIGSEVISDYINQELIYQDKKWNCCFVGKDINNKVHEVNLRSTFDNSNFKGKASGSHPVGTMKYAKKIETLFIAEAVIDAMSYDTMNPNSRNSTSYLSTNGVNNIQQILEKRKDEIQKFNKIILGFDNDEAGRNAVEETKKYFESFYPEKEIGIIIPNQKDFNDDLKALKNNEIEKAVDLKLGKSDTLSLGRS